MSPAARIITGIVLMLVSSIALLAMISFTGAHMGHASQPERNLMGVMGAYMAFVLLKTAGIASFIIPVAMWWGGLAMVRDRDPRRASRRATGVLLLVPCLAGLAHVGLAHIDSSLLYRWDHTHLGGSGGVIGHLMFGAGRADEHLPVGFVREGLDVIGGSVVLGALVIGAFWLIDLGFIRLSRVIWTRWIAPQQRQPSTAQFEPYISKGPAQKQRSTTNAGDLEAIAAGATLPAQSPNAQISLGADDLLRRIRAKRDEVQRASALPATTTNVVPVADIPAPAHIEPPAAANPAPAPLSTPTSAPPAAVQETPRAPVQPSARPLAADRPSTEYTPGGYVLPSKELLDKGGVRKDAEHEAEKNQIARTIEEVFLNFSIQVQVVGASRGPVVTQYELKLLDQAMRVGKVEGFEKDLSLKLGTEGIRIVAPLPNKTTIGIEVPNKVKHAVSMRELVEEIDPATMALPVIIGRDVIGRPLVGDLAKMPHLLVAGATGMGKSVCMNAMICSILLFRTPEEVKFIMVDPKMVELAGYEDIPHLLTAPITDMTKAHAALEWACRTMDERYEALRLTGCRNIGDFNTLGETEIRFRLAKRELKLEDLPAGAHMPYIVVLVDEYADLMMVNKEVEKSIVRLAAKSRACGIHVILTTQRPSADVVTGLIKSNLPSRICFRVVDKNNSRVVLDVSGAENLLGKGDLLFLQPGTSLPARGQGVWLKDSEINAIVEHAKKQGRPRYVADVINVGAIAQRDGESGDSDDADSDGERAEAGASGDASGNAWVSDRMFHEAVQAMYRYDRTGADFFRRRCNVGYNKATKYVEQLEDLGFVSPAKGTASRKILKSWDDWIELLKAQGHTWSEGDDIYIRPFAPGA